MVACIILCSALISHASHGLSPTSLGVHESTGADNKGVLISLLTIVQMSMRGHPGQPLSAFCPGMLRACIEEPYIGDSKEALACQAEVIMSLYYPAAVVITSSQLRAPAPYGQWKYLCYTSHARLYNIIPYISVEVASCLGLVPFCMQSKAHVVNSKYNNNAQLGVEHCYIAK